MTIAAKAPQLTQYEASHSMLSGTPGATITYPGSTNTKGSYVEVMAATSFDATLVRVHIAANRSDLDDQSTLLDVAIGAAGQESIIIPDLLAGHVGGDTQYSSGKDYLFPLNIPSGSRISARMACADNQGEPEVAVQLWGGSAWPASWSGSQVIAYGITAATSKGTAITPAATPTEGTWTSVGTTSQDHKALVFAVQGQSTSSGSGRDLEFDFGIDTSSTATLFESFLLATTITEYAWWPEQNLPVLVQVPSGTTLAARAMSDSGTGVCNVAVYGVS